MISIIIIVKNDRRIANALAALEKIVSKRIEVIVVDASKGRLRDIKQKFSYVRWIYFHNKTNKSITIPEQRNLGVKNAKGDIIVFIDSDCIPDKNWLTELVKPIEQENEKIVSGWVILQDTKSAHAIEANKNLQKKYLDECPTMNVAVTTKVYKKVGGYDESFQFGSDVDFFWRARRAGFNIRFHPKAIIHHDLGDTKHEIRRMYYYGKARTKLYRKNTFRLKFFVGNELLTIFYPLYFVFLPFTFLFYFYPLLILIPLIKYKSPKVVLMRTLYGTGVLKGLLLPE